MSEITIDRQPAMCAASEIEQWLRDNEQPLGCLCGADREALLAAVQILELYAMRREPKLLHAFGLCVRQMHDASVWYLPYHAIAYVMDWRDRPRVWERAGLPPLKSPGRCRYES